MADYIFSLILLIIALAAIELKKSYHQVPKNELRYLAREGDQLAERIYKVVAYEESLEAFLWLIIILCLAGSLIILNQVAPLWLDFLAIILFLWMAFAWLPRLKVTGIGERLVIYLSPGIAYLLNYLHPFFQKISKYGHSSKTEYHTGIYDRQELIELLKNQKRQEDSRIDPNDLELIIRGLKLGGKKVGQHSKTWSKIDHLALSDSIGPVLLDELHKKNQLFVPVLAEKGSSEVVGIVDISRIDLSQVKEIRDVMDHNIYYLNEEDSLKDALTAMTSSGCQVFIVLDQKKRLFGLITLKDVLSELFKLDLSPKDYSQPSEESEAEAPSEHDDQAPTSDGLKTA